MEGGGLTDQRDDAERLRMRERPRAWPVMRQVWRHLAFLHWEVEAEAVRRLLPPGLEVDTWQGRAYVGVVPFTIAGTRTPLLPPLPVLSAFHEVNVRTYVRRAGEGGASGAGVGVRDPGVWFFSLDAASRLAVRGARIAYRLPYYHAKMAMTVSEGGDGSARGAPSAGPTISYSSRRTGRHDGHPRIACAYRPIAPVAEAQPGTLEFFLAERYVLYSWDGRRLRSARVHHPPYPLQVAEVTDLAETLVAAGGVPRPAAPPPLVHYASEVSVRIYAPKMVSPTLAP